MRIWNSKFEGNENIRKIIEVVKNDNELIFLLRRDSIKVYYLGTEILEFSGSSFNYNKAYRKYLSEQEESLLPNKFTFDSWKENLPLLKKSLYNRNYGIKNERIENVKKELEKISEQKILTVVNNNPNSEYYIIDIEYRCDSCPFGRCDMLAISKDKRSDGKHRIAIIELKYGNKSFGKGKGVSNPYGSGIVGHGYNFDCYINGTSEEKASNPSAIKSRLSDLSKELVSMSETYRRFELPYAKYLPVLKDENDLDIQNIQTWLLCVKSNAGTEKGLLNYLGCGRKNARYNVKNNIPAMFGELKYMITEDEYITALYEDDFTGEYAK